jgi:uncharacterized membrane protein YhaH (DUF805 family)
MIEVQMSGMVFCRGCGGSIHSTAPACPKCGAPQAGIETAPIRYGFGNSIARCFARYVQFSGRAPRAEYWYFTLFTTLVSLAAGCFDGLWFDGSPVLSALTNLVFFLPLLTVAVRRLHDGDRSGWWSLAVLIPIAGPIVLLVWFASKGTSGENRFGSAPLAA